MHPTISFLVSKNTNGIVYLVVVPSTSLISADVVNSYSLCSFKLFGTNLIYKPNGSILQFGWEYVHNGGESAGEFEVFIKVDVG